MHREIVSRSTCNWKHRGVIYFKHVIMYKYITCVFQWKLCLIICWHISHTHPLVCIRTLDIIFLIFVLFTQYALIPSPPVSDEKFMTKIIDTWLRTIHFIQCWKIRFRILKLQYAYKNYVCSDRKVQYYEHFILMHRRMFNNFRFWFQTVVFTIGLSKDIKNSAYTLTCPCFRFVFLYMNVNKKIWWKLWSNKMFLSNYDISTIRFALK